MSGRLEQNNDWAALAAASEYRISEMARRCGISTRHLRRLFQRRFHTSPKHQVDLWRAHAVAEQVKGGASVKTAGSDQNFKQSSHVSQFIKRVLKISPRECRHG
jgi:methylphosphotriester-DNA--protein-cysteine methyltransferase